MRWELEAGSWEFLYLVSHHTIAATSRSITTAITTTLPTLVE
jgi:hypothetical protein